MRTRVVLALLYGWLAAPVFATQPPKQVFEYVREVLNSELAATPDVWESNENGGYLFRFDFDVTGDQLPEMFLCSSLGFRGESGAWNVYERLSDGNYRSFQYSSSKARLNLFATELWIEDDGGQRSILTFGRDRMDWAIGRHSFRNGRVTSDTVKATQEEVERRKTAPNVRRTIPNVSGVLLVDLLQNPETEWKQIDFSSRAPNPNGYFVGSTDAERVKGFSHFTPKLAMAWLESAAEGKKVTTDFAAQPLKDETHRDTPVGESISTNREHRGWWILWVVLAGVAGVLLYFLRGHRP